MNKKQEKLLNISCIYHNLIEFFCFHIYIYIYIYFFLCIFYAYFCAKLAIRAFLTRTRICCQKVGLATPGRLHISPHRKFDSIGGTSSATFPYFNYVAPCKICVVFIALLQNMTRCKYLMSRVAWQYPNSSRRYLLPLDGLHILNIDLFEGHISHIKFQMNKHYFTIFGKTIFDNS